ncbi:hypothetical protein OIU74_029517 [Salix koriyanagi]|uniref:Uncharacterized protein n=1 Tax=Salix koriyanagi TaxID=2511006 RepID=A0A9Q0VES0_9ROSI|nr:hypothetical protein OIU74_029517 [Salix koriyanagi]
MVIILRLKSMGKKVMKMKNTDMLSVKFLEMPRGMKMKLSWEMIQRCVCCQMEELMCRLIQRLSHVQVEEGSRERGASAAGSWHPSNGWNKRAAERAAERTAEWTADRAADMWPQSDGAHDARWGKQAPQSNGADSTRRSK